MGRAEKSKAASWCATAGTLLCFWGQCEQVMLLCLLASFLFSSSTYLLSLDFVSLAVSCSGGWC